MEITIASNNLNKIKEIKMIMQGLALSFLSLADLSHKFSITETGTTFAQNAEQKARYVAQYVNGFVLADDSGLEVDALSGAPGVFSARYAGSHATDLQNNQKLLKALKDIPWESRTARYRCVIALMEPEKKIYLSEGTCEGLITFKPSGREGFGYDPVFYVPEYELTMANLSAEIKNRISHRAEALKKTKAIIRELIEHKSRGHRV